MLLILQITQLDYGDAALCALSALRGRAEDPGSAASRLLEALSSSDGCSMPSRTGTRRP